MPKSIEIFENTLLQLITRQGTNSDRLEVVLKSGELGYTTDTKRLFVGDGATLGGINTGNVFKGYVVDLTSVGAGIVGDLAYKVGDKSIYVILSGDGTSLGDWTKIGGGYSAGNGSIYISPDNKISVLSLSAGTISHNLMGASMALDSTQKLTLSSTIFTNSIETQKNTQYLKLPEYLNINSVNYSFPVGELGNNKYLKTDVVGRLSWSPLGSNANYFTYNSGGILPVGTIISTLTSTNLNEDWVLCDGQKLLKVNYPDLSGVIGTTYGSDISSFRVPNLNNRLLYGTSSNPLNSTVYTFTSGTSAASLSAHRSALSAVGVNFFIKAKKDKVIKSTFRVNSPLNITVNGINRNDTTIPALTTLDSDVAISLPTSEIKVNYPLKITKNSADVTGSSVSMFNGDIDITGLENTLTVDDPLKLLVDGIDKTGQTITPYIGDLNLKLNTRNTIQANNPITLKVNGIDKTGIAVDLDTPNNNITLDVILTGLMNSVYPIGSIIFSADNVNPSGRFGGTWQQIAKGRFIVGVGQGTDINSEAKSYSSGNDNIGEYSHKLTTLEMPKHRHSIYSAGGDAPDSGAGAGFGIAQNFDSPSIPSGGPVLLTNALSLQGDDQYHNNAPPACGMYVWERTALA